MFVSDQLTYIQMQKTGCTHIASLLQRFFKGAQIGKHNAPGTADIKSSHFYLSSIRNPWDWYLSLWTFGVQGGGGLKDRLTTRHSADALRVIRRNPLIGLLKLKYELTKDVKSWRAVYTRADDIQAFRAWVALVHNTERAPMLGESYGNSNLPHVAGFMTYRYFYLCCKNHETLATHTFENYDDIKRFDNENAYVDFFIRQEQLEQDFCEALTQVRPLSEDERNAVLSAKKTNTSARALTLEDYYDEETVALIAQRDKLIIDKFGYQAPAI